MLRVNDEDSGGGVELVGWYSYMQNRTAILIIACMNNFKIISSFDCTSIANVCLTIPTAVVCGFANSEYVSSSSALSLSLVLRRNVQRD